MITIYSMATSSKPRSDISAAAKEEGERVLRFCDGVVLKIVPLRYSPELFDEECQRIVTEEVHYQPELISEQAKKKTLSRSLSRRVSQRMKSLATTIYPSDQNSEEAAASQTQMPIGNGTMPLYMSTSVQEDVSDAIRPFTPRQQAPTNASGPDPMTTGGEEDTPTPFEEKQNTSSIKEARNKNFLEENLSSLFPFSRPDLFFESVHALMMLISLYLAVYMTNFVSCSASASWKAISLAPAVLSIIAFIALVRTAALIQAVYKVNYKAILEVGCLNAYLPNLISLFFYYLLLFLFGTTTI